MKISLEHAIGILFSLLLIFLLPKIKIFIIKKKEFKRNKEYTMYKNEFIDKYIKKFYLGILIIQVFYGIEHYSTVNFLQIFLLSYIGMVIMEIDRAINIIPNELIILILIIGISNFIIRQEYLKIIEGCFSMLVSFLIMCLSGKITKLVSGNFGVGAGDIKLVMALSFLVGIYELLDLYTYIICALGVYLLIGFKLGLLSRKSSFPMAVQIMGGFILFLNKFLMIDIFTFIMR